MDKTEIWYGIYEGCKKLVSPAKYTRILEKCLSEFFKDPANNDNLETFTDIDTFPDMSEPNFKENFIQWTRQNKNEVMSWIVSNDVMFKIYDEIENNINPDKYEDMDKYDIEEYVENKIKKAFTAEEIEYADMTECIYLWMKKKYPDKPKQNKRIS